MRRGILAPLLILSVILVHSLTHAQDYEPILESTNIKMKSIENGVQTDTFKVVDLVIFREDDQLEATWTEVVIMPSLEGGKTVLHANQFSTKDDSITNLKVLDENASFDISYNNGRKMIITCIKDGPFINDYQIKGKSVDSITPGGDKTRVEWITIEGIILPSKTVF
jgi:hypothetical protein